MKFYAIFVALFLSWTWVDSIPLDSTTDASHSSHLVSDSINIVVDSDNYSYENVVDGVRSLKKSKADKKGKKTTESKKAPKKEKKTESKKATKKEKKGTESKKATEKGKKGENISTSFGALLNQPHKLEYEKHHLCIPGVYMYGCGDAADVSKGGSHIHAVIKGRRHVKHSGVFVAKSRCDYSDEVLEGTPPDITAQPQTARDGSTRLYRTHPKRDEDCKKNRRLAASPAMMHDPNDHFEYEATVVENSIKYKKYIARVFDMATTNEEKASLHLLQAGLSPDTIEYFEDMEGKPYLIRTYNGGDMLHQTKVTNFELLTTADKEKSTKEIKTGFAGRLRHVIPQPKPKEEISTYDGRNLKDTDDSDYQFTRIPGGCTSESDLCLEIGSQVSPGYGFKIDFYLNVGGDGGQLEAGFTTNSDSTLATATGLAKGCVGVGITGALTLDIDLCLSGKFKYEASSGDASPAVEDYSIDMEMSAKAGILSEVLTLVDITGDLTMKVQDDYFIGYDGLLTNKIDVKIVSLSLGIGVNYETPSYTQYNEPDGWATKFYGQVIYVLDFYFYSDTHTFTHTFSCEPLNNTICGAHGNPNSPASSRYELYENDKLLSGQSLISKNGAYTLRMQQDGNLVLYPLANGRTGASMWASDTSKITEAIFQTDSNFVLYDKNSNAPWESGTSGKNGYVITLQDDGNVIMYDTSGNIMWQIPSASWL
mmetsp:Transcript_57111/g.66741  ORF Transcript_57111/g.66741 Transcript_57111/m.66741 type:complete len:709 (+) Transcript_57111:79-2205(+)|eukprot:CAMPEP_0194371408 /NCGR_PEP_ID=MMETSP0174-20130528/19827_1 /TAXON_ID=216777 /ORGANISM="Proboscia alata, Strain PI-D3" /LENGTH=708 /DNA_ID=CAMNT_0039149463 /DNA_START=73 /DNA_END=2199 /DNA_ORIENTATION=-